MMNISFFRNFLKAYAPSFALRDGLTDMKKERLCGTNFVYSIRTLLTIII